MNETPHTHPDSSLPPVRLVVIGASAGGTSALRELLARLPGDFPCVVAVQHMLPGFCELLRAGIERRSSMKIFMAYEGAPVQDGAIYLADSGRQLMVRRSGGALALALGGAERVSGHCPSVDALFSSVALSAGSSAVGVILTGMGEDGAAGLLAMRKAGAFTIGQDEHSSVVYGMPRAAYESGAVAQQLPLGAIAEALIHQVHKRNQHINRSNNQE